MPKCQFLELQYQAAHFEKQKEGKKRRKRASLVVRFPYNFTVELTVRPFHTLRRWFEPGFGPRDENDAINGALTLTSSDLYITADGDLYYCSDVIIFLTKQ